MNWVRNIAILGCVLAILAMAEGAWLYLKLADSRADVVRIFCVADNAERQKLRQLIVSGAKSSKIFDELFKRYGAPPFDARVRKAQKDASGLYAIDCDVLAEIGRSGSELDKPPRRKGRR